MQLVLLGFLLGVCAQSLQVKIDVDSQICCPTTHTCNGNVVGPPFQCCCDSSVYSTCAECTSAAPPPPQTPAPPAGNCSTLQWLKFYNPGLSTCDGGNNWLASYYPYYCHGPSGNGTDYGTIQVFNRGQVLFTAVSAMWIPNEDPASSKVYFFSDGGCGTFIDDIYGFQCDVCTATNDFLVYSFGGVNASFVMNWDGN
jgi:hypothetical protein